MAAKATEVRRQQPSRAAKISSQPAVIELSSDSEEEEPDVEDSGISAREAGGPSEDEEEEQPLMRAAGIKYPPHMIEAVRQSTPKLPVRVKESGSARHRHVSIEIPLPSSKKRPRDDEDERDGAESSKGGESDHEEVFKTPSERRHIKFDDSDLDEFVTPREAPLKNPLESSLAPAPEKEEQQESEEDDSDDEAPEAVSTHAAKDQNDRAAKAAAEAAERQAAEKKRKRQERDDFFKQQARKKKLSENSEAKSQQGDGQHDGHKDKVRPDSDAAPSKKPVSDRLPLHLLDSDDEDKAPRRSKNADVGKHKRPRLDPAEALAEPKRQRDRKVGSTLFKVMPSRGEEKLPPKASKRSSHLRETLLYKGKKIKSMQGILSSRW